MTTDQTVPATFRIPESLRARLDERADLEDISAASIVRRALLRHLDGEDMARAVSPGADERVVPHGVPTEVCVLLRFTLRTDTLMAAREIADRALTLANAKIRSVGADDEIEVVGPWFNRTSLGWSSDVPPPVTLHFIQGETGDPRWRWNDITVDGMVGVFRAPEADGVWTMYVRLPGDTSYPLVMVPGGHDERHPHSVKGHWYVDETSTHPTLFDAIRRVGSWESGDGQTGGPLGQLGPVRLIDHDTLRAE